MRRRGRADRALYRTPRPPQDNLPASLTQFTLFQGSRSISLSLNRTFVLPENPRTIEFQIQGDDLIDICTRLAAPLLVIEPTDLFTRLSRRSRLPRVDLRTGARYGSGPRSGRGAWGTSRTARSGKAASRHRFVKHGRAWSAGKRSSRPSHASPGRSSADRATRRGFRSRLGSVAARPRNRIEVAVAVAGRLSSASNSDQRDSTATPSDVSAH